MRRILLVVTVLLAGTVIDAALPASDNFNRAGEASLGGNWTAPDGLTDSSFELASNQLTGKGLSTFQLQYWNADVFNGNHFSQATLGGTLPAGAYGGVAVRVQSTGQNSYVFGMDNGSAGGYKIEKIVAGANTSLQACAGTPTAGDVLKLSITGTSLTATINGAGTCTVTDATFSGGASGLWGYGGLGGYNLDDWSGDNVGGGGGGGGGTGHLSLLGMGK